MWNDPYKICNVASNYKKAGRYIFGILSDENL